MWPNTPVEDLEEDDNEIRKLPTVMFVSSASYPTLPIVMV